MASYIVVQWHESVRLPPALYRQPRLTLSHSCGAFQVLQHLLFGGPRGCEAWESRPPILARQTGEPTSELGSKGADPDSRQRRRRCPCGLGANPNDCRQYGLPSAGGRAHGEAADARDRRTENSPTVRRPFVLLCSLSTASKVLEDKSRQTDSDGLSMV